MFHIVTTADFHIKRTLYGLCTKNRTAKIPCVSNFDLIIYNRVVFGIELKII
jgi:hypothetical protein